MKTKIQNLIKKVALVVGVAATISSAQASTDYGPAVWRQACSGNWYTSGVGKQMYVEHDMEGYYLSTISYLQGCGTSVSVHYCVNGKSDNGTDAAPGEVTQMVLDANYAWHAVCLNTHSMSTEHEGFASNPAWYTPEMYQASALLTRSKAVKYGFAKDRNHIVGHGEWQNGAWVNWVIANLGFDPRCNSHTDPGPYWDWTGFMNRINSTKNKFGDYDGDGKADAVVFRPSTGYWYFSGSAGASWNKPSFGYSTDIPVPMDYDGDGKMDAAVFRPSTGYWYFSGSAGATWNKPSFGYSTDIPVPGDYDGDGKADVAVWRPSNGTWYFATSTGLNFSVAFGQNGDIPVPADYDGDGKLDAAVFRPSTGYWYFSGSAGATWNKPSFGYSTDIPVPGDYDGDGKADVAVWRPSNGTWYFATSTGLNFSVTFGQNGDIPVPADYDGDGKLDAATWRPSNATWYISKSTGGSFSVQYGQTGDKPMNLPAAIRQAYFP